VKPSRRTPDDTVDLLHPAVPPGRAAEFQVLTERDELKTTYLKKKHPAVQKCQNPQKKPGIFCTRINKKSDDRVEETRFPETVGERSPTDSLLCVRMGNTLQGISKDPAVNVKKEQAKNT
jgi:hypothetical protein